MSMKYLSFLLVIALTLLSCKQNEVQKTENSINQNTVLGNKSKKTIDLEELTLKDLQSLLTTPDEISTLKRKGYSFLLSNDENGKIYVGTEKDTISVYKGQILWKGKNIKTFQSIEKGVDKLAEKENNYGYKLYNNEYEKRESKQFSKNGLSYVLNKSYLNNGLLYDFFIMSSEATSDGE